MIIEQMIELDKREHLLADEGYAPQKVHALISIDRDGNFHGLQSTLVPVQRGNGKPKLEPAMYSVPAPEGRRTSGDATNFLYDKSDYVFGVGESDPKKLDNRKRLFRELIDEAFAATNDEGLQAVARFLERYDRGDVPIEFAADRDPSSVYTFQDIDDSTLRISDRSDVRAWWRARRSGSGAEVGPCIICGKTRPLARIHPEIKNVPGGNAAGVALVSFNAGAFASFGFSSEESHKNAPFCRDCADGYTRALNRLLSPAFPDPLHPGLSLLSGNYRLSNDTVALFWSNVPASTGFLGHLFAGDDGTIGAVRAPTIARAAYAAPHDGSMPAIDATRFYSIILSGAQGRAVLRSSFELTMAEVVTNLQKWFDDIELVRMYANEPQFPPLFLMIRALQAPGARSTVAATMAQQIYECAIRGTRYPQALLDAALRRLRAGEPFSHARIAIIKAVLNRSFAAEIKKEITMALDPENTQPGYRLGRLFAVLEKLQADAINSPNATIVDRYFGAACATPAVVFPRLMKLAQHHASKAARGDWYQRQIQDVVAGLNAEDAFPSTLPLAQQGLFSVGYYHQRADLFTSKKGAADAVESNEVDAVEA